MPKQIILDIDPCRDLINRKNALRAIYFENCVNNPDPDAEYCATLYEDLAEAYNDIVNCIDCQIKNCTPDTQVDEEDEVEIDQVKFVSMPNSTRRTGSWGSGTTPNINLAASRFLNKLDDIYNADWNPSFPQTNPPPGAPPPTLTAAYPNKPDYSKCAEGGGLGPYPNSTASKCCAEEVMKWYSNHPVVKTAGQCFALDAQMGQCQANCGNSDEATQCRAECVANRERQKPSRALCRSTMKNLQDMQNNRDFWLEQCESLFGPFPPISVPMLTGVRYPYKQDQPSYNIGEY